MLGTITAHMKSGAIHRLKDDIEPEWTDAVMADQFYEWMNEFTTIIKVDNMIIYLAQVESFSFSVKQ